MPTTQVIFFQDEAGHAPVLDWLQDLQEENAKSWANCRARIVLLSQFGHELRRPAVEFLRDGIYELRAKQGHVQYRILYFFHNRNVAVLSHSITKEDSIPPVEIERALKRKRQFEQNPEKHSYAED
jgi:phage-related protein